MPDILIRNFPSEDLERLDEQARQVGLSRTEFLRRHLHRQARIVATRVTPADLAELSDVVSDLADPDVMDDAWS